MDRLARLKATPLPVHAWPAQIGRTGWPQVSFHRDRCLAPSSMDWPRQLFARRAQRQARFLVFVWNYHAWRTSGCYNNIMVKKIDSPWQITPAAIAKLTREIVERFRPDRIILFGSHAYGEPNNDSDVDLLVVRPAKNMVNQAAKIRLALDYDFPLDLIVRTPEYLQERLQMNDWFVREILNRGKVLYEKRPPGSGCERRNPITVSRKKSAA